MSSSIGKQNDTRLIQDLVLANRILAQHGVLDTFGHVAARSSSDPSTFFIATRKAPSLVTPNDIVRHYVETGEPADHTGRVGPWERYIHSGLFKARPDVIAVLHCHSPILVSFSVLREGVLPLRPMLAVGANTGLKAPIYDIARNNGRKTNMLVNTLALGQDLAKTFTQNAGSDMVLMRGHGATIVSGVSVRDLVHRAIYAVVNATVLRDARLLAGGASSAEEDIIPLWDGEIEACLETGTSVDSRSWPVWVQALGADNGLS